MISLFIESGEGGIKEILDDDTYRKKYSKINIRKLLMIFDKYKDEKVLPIGGGAVIDDYISKLPRIKKADIAIVVKKLKESLNLGK